MTLILLSGIAWSRPGAPCRCRISWRIRISHPKWSTREYFYHIMRLRTTNVGWIHNSLSDNFCTVGAFSAAYYEWQLQNCYGSHNEAKMMIRNDKYNRLWESGHPTYGKNVKEKLWGKARLFEASEEVPTEAGEALTGSDPFVHSVIKWVFAFILSRLLRVCSLVSFDRQSRSSRIPPLSKLKQSHSEIPLFGWANIPWWLVIATQS